MRSANTVVKINPSINNPISVVLPAPLGSRNPKYRIFGYRKAHILQCRHLSKTFTHTIKGHYVVHLANLNLNLSLK